MNPLHQKNSAMHSPLVLGIAVIVWPLISTICSDE